MNRQARIQELIAEIHELEALIAKAELNNDVEGKWVVYLLRSVLKRRKLALKQIRKTTVTMH